MILAAALAATVAAPPHPPPPPPPPRRWALHLGGGIALASPAFTGSSRFTEFAEQGSIGTRATPRAGGAFEAGLWNGVSRHFGLALAVSAARRDAPGTFSAALPHPLYLDRDRHAEGALPASIQRETALHLGLAWSGAGGGVTARLFAGPSYVIAQADLARAVTHTEAYPYDAVQVTGVRTESVRGDAVGFHAGLALERRLGARMGAGVGARWTRATIDLASGNAASETERQARMKAGGLAAGAALSFYF